MRNRIGGEKQPQRKHPRTLDKVTADQRTILTNRTLPEHPHREIQANRCLRSDTAFEVVEIRRCLRVSILYGSHHRRSTTSTTLEARRRLLGP